MSPCTPSTTVTQKCLNKTAVHAGNNPHRLSWWTLAWQNVLALPYEFCLGVPMKKAQGTE
jgi:hypothetical protein